jgi:RimJ/RimL family protein N-acetyltransferase
MMVYFTCTKQCFIAIDSSPAGWLNREADYDLARDYWKSLGQDLLPSTWLKAHEVGYRYAAIVENGKIVSIAGVWRFSEKAWEVGPVSTLKSFRRKGYAKRVVAFATVFILDAGRLATCATCDDNMAMIATAKSVGFREIPQDRIWWSYPKPSDF